MEQSLWMGVGNIRVKGLGVPRRKPLHEGGQGGSWGSSPRARRMGKSLSALKSRLGWKLPTEQGNRWDPMRGQRGGGRGDCG